MPRRGALKPKPKPSGSLSVCPLASPRPHCHPWPFCCSPQLGLLHLVISDWNSVAEGRQGPSPAPHVLNQPRAALQSLAQNRIFQVNIITIHVPSSNTCCSFYTWGFVLSV